MNCKKCNKEFHYCSSCGTDGYSEDGYCSDECKKDHLDYSGFYKYFKKLLHKTDSCFERDVLRESKDDLWESWCYWENKRLKKASDPTPSQKTNVSYVYCSSCGYEDFDCYVGYSRTTANGDWYLCPGCGEETSSVDKEE